jgi:hypothetical protein
MPELWGDKFKGIGGFQWLENIQDVVSARKGAFSYFSLLRKEELPMAKDMPKMKIPQNSAGYVPAMNMDKKNPKPVKKTGNDLRSGK